MSFRRAVLAVLLFALAVAPACADDEREEGAPAAERPAATTVVPLLGHEVRLPAGLTIAVYAEDLGAPRFMALDPDGVLHVTDRLGRVLKLPDADGDGVADRASVVVDGLNSPHGIAFHDGALYIAEETQVVRVADVNSDGVPEAPVPVIPDLPEGNHWSRTIVFGPDGRLYLAVGSSCNVCVEESPLRATIWRYAADGSGGAVFATGLRNAVGLAFDAEGRLWATNNGRDGMGDDVPPETLNLVTEGADFGWPRCHAGDIEDPQYGASDSCAGVTPPAVKMQAHSAPLGLAFGSSELLDGGYAEGMFIAFHGSWDRTEATGYKVVWLPFEDGAPTGAVVDFATGWLLADDSYWGRPVDVLPAPDGSLFISDDNGGRIYRISVAD